MKTEGLTQIEAYKAVLDDYLVKSANGYVFKKGNGFIAVQSGDTWILAHGGIGYEPPYSIVQPEVKSLSFEEALKCKRVLVKLYDGNTYRAVSPFTLEAYSIIDLAERRGWPITAITETAITEVVE